MVLIHSHICLTNTPILQGESEAWEVSKAIVLGRKGMGKRDDENAQLASCSDFSSFNNYRLHLHYEHS